MSIRTYRFRIAVVALFVVLYLLPLGARPMSSPDEYRYGQIPAEMLDGGDWVVPHLDGMPYFEKPVLGYWLNAASMAVFGRNAFAVRLPAAFGAGLMALLVFLLVKIPGRDDSEPALAAMAVLTCRRARRSSASLRRLTVNFATGSTIADKTAIKATTITNSARVKPL